MAEYKLEVFPQAVQAAVVLAVVMERPTAATEQQTQAAAAAVLATRLVDQIVPAAQAVQVWLS